MAQIECPEGKVHVVTSDIGKGASAKVPPMPPVKVCPAGVVGLLGNGTEPEIPIEVPWHSCWKLLVTCSPAGAGANPDVDLMDFANRAGANQLHNPAVV